MTSSHWRRRAAVPLVVTGLVLALAACGSSTNATASSGKSSSTSYNSMSVSQLASAAAKEGSLTWYTTFASSDVAPMIAAFNQQYPNVKVNPLRLSADKIPARVMTEQRGGKYNADVISGDSPQLAQLLQAGALQAYTPPDLAPLPSGLSLPSGYQGVVYLVTTVIGYNPKILAQKHLSPPTSWQDLTKPAWKGQFSIDPGAVNWYDSLVQSMGASQALALIKALGANKPSLVSSHTQALTQVQAGEPAAAATAYGYKAASLEKKTPNSMAFVNPTPLPSSLTMIDLAKNAPHPAAARLFEDWMISQAGQEQVVKLTNHTSIRSDVTNDPKVWDPSKWTPAWGVPDMSSSTYNSELSDMKNALNAP